MPSELKEFQRQSEEVLYPVFLEDIAIVRVTESPFFATLSFEMMAMADDPTSVSFLNPIDAEKMENIIIGAMESKRQDIPAIESKKPRRRLEKIGKLKQI